MAWARTLGDLVTDVTRRCDVDGFTARHSTASVRRLIIESYHRLRDWMTSVGSKRWIVGPSLLAVSGEEHLGYACKVPLDGATRSFERIQLVEALINGRWQELTPISLGEIRDTYSIMNSYGQPSAWTYESAMSEPTATGSAFDLIITPDFDPTSTSIRVYGIADTNITDDDATTLYLDGPGFEWIIWDAVIKISARDNDSANTAGIARAEREEQHQQILRSVRQEMRNVVQRRDVFHGTSRFFHYRRVW